MEITRRALRLPHRILFLVISEHLAGRIALWAMVLFRPRPIHSDASYLLTLSAASALLRLLRCAFRRELWRGEPRQSYQSPQKLNCRAHLVNSSAQRRLSAAIGSPMAYSLGLIVLNSEAMLPCLEQERKCCLHRRAI